MCKQLRQESDHIAQSHGTAGMVIVVEVGDIHATSCISPVLCSSNSVLAMVVVVVKVIAVIMIVTRERGGRVFTRWPRREGNAGYGSQPT